MNELESLTIPPVRVPASHVMMMAFLGAGIGAFSGWGIGALAGLDALGPALVQPTMAAFGAAIALAFTLKVVHL